MAGGRIERNFINCYIKKRQATQEEIADKFPCEYEIVQEIRRQLYLNKIVVAVTDWEVGRILYCYASTENIEPYWGVKIVTFTNELCLYYKVRDCRFFYISDNGKLKEIKSKRKRTGRLNNGEEVSK